MKIYTSSYFKYRGDRGVPEVAVAVCRAILEQTYRTYVRVMFYCVGVKTGMSVIEVY